MDIFYIKKCFTVYHYWGICNLQLFPSSSRMMSAKLGTSCSCSSSNSSESQLFGTQSVWVAEDSIQLNLSWPFSNFYTMPHWGRCISFVRFVFHMWHWSLRSTKWFPNDTLQSVSRLKSTPWMFGGAKLEGKYIFDRTNQSVVYFNRCIPYCCTINSM